MTRKSAWPLAAALCLATALAGSAGAQQQPYIPLISKGFQHQFWQAVKSGAEKAGKDYNVRITFEGPETEAMVDKQIDMLSSALAKHPAAIGFAALDSKAAAPLLSSKVDSWQTGVNRNVEGRQVRRVLGYYGGAVEYRKRTGDVAAGGYRELKFDEA